MIEVTAIFSHGFEDFTLSDPACPSRAVWVEYGGTTSSGTINCCGVGSERKRAKPLVVENISIPLVEDKLFRSFDRMIQRKPSGVAKATVIGRFFSGQPQKSERGVDWVGYGHLGFYSLLVIQQVLSVERRQ